ncbi:heat shock factor protein 3 isoform X2 [Amia ocellicauda]|uniref:heat shock factor protein 3 isoform X2 n=1 Tax=Amia ocellicauda TaxID=2972642 RepID=UPI003463D894
MMKHSNSVPGFISKLWMLVDNQGTNEVICWSLNGLNFRILDEERFTKDILPKYFKHNNLSSFVRQLNMYGFRKVISIEGGLVKPKQHTALEFHHPHFQRGQEEQLELIRRKVSSVRTEDTKISQEDMYKILEDVQQVKGKQEDMFQKIESMKRDNEMLLKEIVSLRRKHNQQQKTLSKVIQFILSLVQGNCVFGIQRKRPLTLDSSEAPPAKTRKAFVLRTHESPAPMNSSSSNSAASPGRVTILDVTNNPKENTSDAAFPVVSQQVTTHKPEKVYNFLDVTSSEMLDDSQTDLGGSWALPSSHLALEACDNGTSMFSTVGLQIPTSQAAGKETIMCKTWKTSSSSQIKQEAPIFPDILPDCVMKEVTPSVSKTATTKTKNDIQETIDCIDSSFEDIQSLLLGKQFNIRPEFISDLFNPGMSAAEINMPESDFNLGPVSEWLENTADVPETSKGNEVVQSTPAQILSVLDTLCNNLDPEKRRSDGSLSLLAEDSPPPPVTESQLGVTDCFGMRAASNSRS